MTLTWDDLPPQPWPEATEPPVAALAGWLLSLSREQFEWLLDKKRQDWSRDSDCFVRDHEGQLRDARRQLDAARDDVAAMLEALGLGSHARPYSAHEVIQREALPAIERLRSYA